MATSNAVTLNVGALTQAIAVAIQEVSNNQGPSNQPRRSTMPDNEPATTRSAARPSP